MGGGRRVLVQWLFDLKRALGPEPLAGLEGGEGVLTALWLSRNPWPGSAHEQVLAGARLDGAGFLAWVGDVLEAGQFVPQDVAGHRPSEESGGTRNHILGKRRRGGAEQVKTTLLDDRGNDACKRLGQGLVERRRVDGQHGRVQGRFFGDAFQLMPKEQPRDVAARGLGGASGK